MIIIEKQRRNCLLQTNASCVDHVLSKQRLHSRRPRERKLSDSSSNIFRHHRKRTRKKRKREKPSITRHRNVSRSPRIDPRDDASTRATNRASLFPYSPKVRNQVKNLDTLTL